MDEMTGTIVAYATHLGGLQNNYKENDYVKVSMTFTFSTDVNKFVGMHPGTTNHIIGLFSMDSIVNINPENPLSKQTPNSLTFINKNNNAGLVVDDNGAVKLVSAGMTGIVIKAFGFGLQEDMVQTWAQNHLRIIANSPPYFISKEAFGMFTGLDAEDQASHTMDRDLPVFFKRFVSQSIDDENWVSTCEGAYSPWVGPNNNFDQVAIGKEVLLSKIINHGDSRVTLEMGAPGESFFNLRIDKVIVGETKATQGAVGANTAKLGNYFKLNISDTGVVDLRAASNAVPLNNINGFHLTIDAAGNLTVHSKGKITFSHGDADVSNNSIILDPAAGIDITAANGVKVNGKYLVNSDFLDWMVKNQAGLCLVTAVGAPAPISQTALPAFTAGTTSVGETVTFTTQKKGSPAGGLITDKDDFSTV